VEDLAGEISEFLIGKARVDAGGTCRGGEEGTRHNDVDHRARDEGGAAGGRTVLQAEDVWLTYGRSLPGEKTALRGVSLGLDRGELVGLLGDTGSGKSTLLAILGGLLRPDKGKVELEGESIFSRRRSGKLGVVFQFAEDQMVAETVLEDVAYGPRRQGRKEADGRRVAAEALEKVGVGSALFGRSLEALSFGERRLAALAGILAMAPDFLLLDEPTAGLDGMTRIDLLRLLRELAREGRGILVATHDVELIAEVADRVVVLRDGEVWREGPVDILWRDCEISREVGLSHHHLLRLVKELERWGCSIAPKRMTPTSVAEALVGRSQG
jgi:energy-coupling factor transport system ATP-binding protein